MIKLHYRIGKQKYTAKISTSYAEITIGQLITDTFESLTGIPSEQLEQFPEELLQEIQQYILLIPQSLIISNDYFIVRGLRRNIPTYIAGTKYTHYPDYGEMLIGQFEDFKSFTQEKEGIELIPYIMAFLTKATKTSFYANGKFGNSGIDYDYNKRLALIPEIEKLPASIGMAFLNKYYQNIEVLQKRFLFLHTEEPDKDAGLLEEAGIESLNQFGFYNNADMLAGGNMFQIEKILNTLTVNQVYYHLTYVKTKNRVQRNYQELKRKEALKNEI